ncbi:MAG: GTP-binding protein [Pseudomonadota bacterium]
MTAIARKLCLLGDFSVGKTSLIRRYVHDEFSADYRATVGVQIHQYNDCVDGDGSTVELSQVIWDIEGSRFGKDLIKNYVVGSAGAVVIGDATRSDAASSMASHARIFLGIMPGRPLVFAMNKCDLVAKDERPQVGSLVEEFGGGLVYTSALTGESVRPLFRALGMRILEIGA